MCSNRCNCPSAEISETEPASRAGRFKTNSFRFFLSSFSDNTKKNVSVKGFSFSGILTSHPEQMSAGLNGTKRKDSIFTLWTW